MQIGLNLSTSAAAGADPVADAVDAERLGFDFVSVTDHLHGTHPTFETWTLLCYVGAATERVRLVTNVLGLPYRAPTVTAKMAESLDRLSGGRFVLGLGAGGADVEFDGFGVAIRTPGEKVDALIEALDVIRGLWREQAYTFGGDHYRAWQAQLEPKPDRPIPIWLGAYGPRMLEVVGRFADGWLPSMPFAGPDVIPAMMQDVLYAASESGRDPSRITKAYNVPVRVGKPTKRPGIVAGEPDVVVDQLRWLGDELGFDALNIWPVGEEAEQRQRFAEEVLPHLRD